MQTGALRSVARKVRDEVAPLQGLIGFRAYRRLQARPRYCEGSVMFRGRRLRYSDAEGFAHSLVEIYRQQVYLFDDRTGSPHIIDAGANIGLSVLYFKDRFPRASVVAYEPDEEIFDMLADNVGQLPDVTLHRAAAWIADTELTFYRERSLAGSVAADFDGRGDKVKVPAVRLRDEITKRRVTFLKIDIEGAENEVLFDIADVLDNVERLFFEYHSVAGDRQRLGQLLNLVTERGFRFVINGTHGPGLPFVESARFGFDLQCNVFCYRNLPN